MTPRRRKRVRQVGRRAGWGLADQAFSSLTNFAVGVAVARALGPDDFGAFTLAFVTYLLVVNASRAVTTEPFVVRYTGADPGRWRAGARAATGTALALGCAAGIGCLLTGWAVGGRVGAAYVGVGITLPGLLLQDCLRFCFFARERPEQAFVNDLIWFVLLVPGMALLVATGRDTMTSLALMWGGSATVAALAGIIQSGGLFPAPARALSWLKEQRDLAPRYLAEMVTMSGTDQLLFFGVGVVAGLGAVGAIRGAQIVLGLPFVLITGVRLVAVPEAVKLAKTSLNRLQRSIVLMGAALAATVLLFGAATMWLLHPLGSALFGETWNPITRVLLPETLSQAAYGAQLGVLVGLRALAAAGRSLRARLCSGPVMALGAIAGAALNGVVGAAWGHAVGNWIGVLAWSWQFARALRERRGRRHAAGETLPIPLAEPLGAVHHD